MTPPGSIPRRLFLDLAMEPPGAWLPAGELRAHCVEVMEDGDPDDGSAASVQVMAETLYRRVVDAYERGGYPVTAGRYALRSLLAVVEEMASMLPLSYSSHDGT